MSEQHPIPASASRVYIEVITALVSVMDADYLSRAGSTST
jgi:hypothetical protein